LFVYFVVFGCIWPFIADLAVYGCIWLYMADLAAYGCNGLYMGWIWLYMDVCGCI
jgi:hypothetical protein